MLTEWCDAVGVSTVITLRGYQLDIATQLPAELKNKDIRGLLGNYNGISSDDLISRTGQTLEPNSTEERIYYDFGETCKLFVISCNLKLLCEGRINAISGQLCKCYVRRRCLLLCLRTVWLSIV